MASKRKKNLLPVASIYKEERRAINGRRLYTCNACGSLEPWSNDHLWFGSWRDLEDSGQVIVACSEQCRTELVGIGLIPKDAELPPTVPMPRIDTSNAPFHPPPEPK